MHSCVPAVSFQHGIIVVELCGTLLRSGVLFQVEAVVSFTAHRRRAQKCEEASTVCPPGFGAG